MEAGTLSGSFRLRRRIRSDSAQDDKLYKTWSGGRSVKGLGTTELATLLRQVCESEQLREVGLSSVLFRASPEADFY